MTIDPTLTPLIKNVKNFKVYQFSGRTGRLLEEQGHSKEFIQALMGHTDQAMTEHYLEDGSIDWQMAEAALKL